MLMIGGRNIIRMAGYDDLPGPQGELGLVNESAVHSCTVSTKNITTYRDLYLVHNKTSPDT